MPHACRVAAHPLRLLKNVDVVSEVAPPQRAHAPKSVLLRQLAPVPASTHAAASAAVCWAIICCTSAFHAAVSSAGTAGVSHSGRVVDTPPCVRVICGSSGRSGGVHLT